MARTDQNLRGSTTHYTDLFHRSRVDSWPQGDFRKRGDASKAVDRDIGRVVLRLAGSVPASNSLRLPRRQEDSLGAAGRFLYVQLRLEVGKPYAIHADVTAADRGVHRVSVSNLYASQAAVRMKRSGVQVFMPAAHEGWTLLALDLGALTRQATSSAYAKLRALHLCANMTVRGAFTSDVRYDWQSLPTDLSFTTAFDLAQAQVLWVPEEPQGAAAAAPKRRPCSPHPPLPARPPSHYRKAGQHAHAVDTSAGAAEQPQSVQLLPTPIAGLEHVSAFSGSRSPCLLHWVPGSGAGGGQEVVFAAGSLIVCMSPSSGQQRHLRGHDGPVCAMALAAEEARLASAEDGPGAALRLWDLRSGHCLATVPGHAGGTLCLDLSADGRLLATVGVDAAGRQALVCWDVSACWAVDGSGGSSGGRAVELARHVSEYNIQAVRFVPYSPEALVTCGKNSIRSYRLRAGQLRGVSVPMDGVQALRQPYSCGTLATPSAAVGEVFTCLSFEHSLRVRPLEARRLYVGSLSGALYTVNLDGRAVEGVVQLHSGALAALTAHDGFCVTGSADRLLRVWGSDLQQVYLEAQHEGPVTGVALSPDGLWAVVGTQGGTLSLLDIASQTYSTLLRSHTAAVHAVALMEGGCGAPQYVTGGADGTLRVWDVGSHQQVLELSVAGEVVLSVACHPSKPEVACGFRGGLVRIFNCSSGALIQESQQHRGPVTRLTYARHGRLLLSLGNDGCVCVHDAQRTYMPTAYIQAGSPLHATAMAASKDGRLLAVSALVKSGSASRDRQNRSSTGQPDSHGRKAKCGSVAGGTSQQPVIALYDLDTLQPVLQLPVASRSRVVQLELLPDDSQLLAVTTDGRLLGYRCCDGAIVLEVPLCLPGSCSALALDPTASFLVAASLAGHLRVWGLQQLHKLPNSALPATPEVIRCLPSQELSGLAGSATLGATFATSGATGLQLLTVGEAAEVCCWHFPGHPASIRQATRQTTPAPATRLCQPTVQLLADCTSAAPVAPSAPTRQDLMQPSPEKQLQLEAAAGPAVEQPAPRPLPAALQHLPVRPPSAPPAPSKHLAAAAARTGAAGCAKQAASLPGSPLRVGFEKAPLCLQATEEGPEATLLITATHAHRCTQVVRQHKQLRVTSPYKKPGLSAGKQPQRSAAWVDGEVAGDRVPPHHPRQQLRLLPPSASVQHVHGFDAGAGFCLRPNEPSEQGQQQLVYAAGNILLERGPSGQQRHIARLPRSISAVAVHGGLAAVAVEPVWGGGSTAEVHLIDAGSGRVHSVLSHHSYSVQRMCFSRCGRLLATLSSGSSPPGTSLALWSVEGQSSVLVAAVQLPEVVADLTWSSDTTTPTFYTASSQGLTEWRLGPDALDSTVVHMPAVLRGAELSAAACVASAEGDGSTGGRGSRWCFKDRGAAVFVGDSSGRIWRMVVDDGQDGRDAVLIAELPGQAVSCMAARRSLCAVGTADGSLLLLAEEEGVGGKAASWRVVSCEQLDGPVVSLQLNADGRGVAAATASGTLWHIGGAGTPSAVLCGQQHRVQGWHLVPGAAWKGAGPTAALASAAGLAIWQLGVQAGKGDSRAANPLVEFCVPAGATHASLAGDASYCAATYKDGSVCLFDTAAASMRWKVAAAAAGQSGEVVGLAVVQRLRGLKVMVACGGGALYVLDGGTGQVAHRSMQFAAVQDSGRRCPSNFPLAGLTVCPADSAVFALRGEHDLVVCRSAWSKNAAVHTLARLSFAESPDAATSAGAPPGSAVQAVFSPRHPGHLYCTNPTEFGQLLLFDYSRAAVVKTLLVPLAGSTAITALAVHPSEELLAVGTASGSVLLLRLETEAWAELSAHGSGDAVVGLAFSACGSRLFTAAGTAAFEWCTEEA